MAGHSKWKNIQHRKGRQDAIRGKLFNKLAREIYVAASSGDKDPENNHQLRLAIAKAKAQNVPNDNIDRAIQKAVGGGDGSKYESIVYEGYGPSGIAVMLDILTDNRNRTAADIRHIFSKRGGNLGTSGCVAWMFARKGLLVLERQSLPVDEDLLFITILESGAEDYEVTPDAIEITTAPEDFEQVKKVLEVDGIVFTTAEITMIPHDKIMIEGEALNQILDLIEVLEEHDDVQNVYANFDMDETTYKA